MEPICYHQLIRENIGRIDEEADYFTIETLSDLQISVWIERAVLLKMFKQDNVIGDFYPRSIFEMGEFDLRKYRGLARMHLNRHNS